MKIVCWNCNGGLRRKLEALDRLHGDVYVIQECEDPSRSTPDYLKWAENYLWVGTSKNKGIGVFPKNGNRVKQLTWSGSFNLTGINPAHSSATWKTEDLQLFLPFSLNDELTLLGIWTKGSRDEAFRYIGQLWKYIQIHQKDISAEKTILLGDLNSNAQWDKQDRWWSHSGVVKELEHLGLVSLYHSQTGEKQGQETNPTFYLHRKTNRPYHIDYAFMSNDLINSWKLSLGDTNDWISFSDHVPLLISSD